MPSTAATVPRQQRGSPGSWLHATITVLDAVSFFPADIRQVKCWQWRKNSSPVSLLNSLLNSLLTQVKARPFHFQLAPEKHETGGNNFSSSKIACRRQKGNRRGCKPSARSRSGALKPKAPTVWSEIEGKGKAKDKQPWLSPKGKRRQSSSPLCQSPSERCIKAAGGLSPNREPKPPQ